MKIWVYVISKTLKILGFISKKKILKAPDAIRRCERENHRYDKFHIQVVKESGSMKPSTEEVAPVENATPGVWERKIQFEDLTEKII